MGSCWPTRPRPTPSPKPKDPESAALANKIVDVLIDEINHSVIRPGPSPEERECYDVARELRGMNGSLTDLVHDILEVHKAEGTKIQLPITITAEDKVQ